ncbi:MAG: peptidase T [Clostridia bacterium]
MEKVLNKFLRYVKIDTTSDENSASFPSTEKQKNLSRLLCAELLALGLEAETDNYGYVYATIPSNASHLTHTLGFIAHVDTSPAVSGSDVKPQVVAYKGGNIVINNKKDIVLSNVEYPELNDYVGQSLVTSDGTTLLGADDKAGVAEIMAMAEYLVENPNVKHGVIKIAFTPDEEVGAGVDKFDVKKFGADFAYTLDGGKLGEIEYENFNAASAKLQINGTSIHPGTAKGKMKNAIELAMEFFGHLPKYENPAYTEGYEGFYLLNNISGSVESAQCEYIIRDHDIDKFKSKCEFFTNIAVELNKKYGLNTFEVILREQYLNMRDKILPHFHLIDNAELAMKLNGVLPIIQPIRGGTDGARLSFMGLPCPNLSTGGHNFHGRFEYIPVESMEAMVQVALTLVKLYSDFQIK